MSITVDEDKLQVLPSKGKERKGKQRKEKEIAHTVHRLLVHGRIDQVKWLIKR